MLPTGTISDIFEPSIEKEMIVVRPKLAGTDGQMRCTVKGLTGPCTVAIFAEHNAPDGGINALQFAHRDFSNSQEIFRHTMLFAARGFGPAIHGSGRAGAKQKRLADRGYEFG